MHQSRFARRVLAATITALIAVSGTVAAATPVSFYISGFSSDLLSSGLSEDTPAPVETTTSTAPVETTTSTAPVETTTPAPVDEAKLQDVVPDMDLRRYLNTEEFDRADAPDTPISAAQMATLKNLGNEGFGDELNLVPEGGGYYEECGEAGCRVPRIQPNLEGVQYATNLEVLNVRNVSKLPELGTMPYLRYFNLYGSRVEDYSPLVASKFPALRALLINSDIDGVYPQNLNEFTQLEFLELGVEGVGDLPSEITELSTLKTLHYAATDQVSLPETINNMQALERLALSGNLFDSGSTLAHLPDSLAELDNLKEFDIRKNEALIPLPAVLLELDSLEIVTTHLGTGSEPDPVRDQLEERGVWVV